MELKELSNIFSILDRASREDQLRCVSKHHKTIFCTYLVSDLVTKTYPLDYNILKNCIDHYSIHLNKRIDLKVKLEIIKIVTGWIKNRNISFDSITNSVEAIWAYQILTFSDSSDNEFQIAGEFLKMTTLLVNMKAYNCRQFIQKILELDQLFILNITLEKAKVLTQIFVAAADKIFQLTTEQSDEIKRRTEIKDRILSILIKLASFKECCELELPFWKKLPTYLKSSKIYEQFVEEIILCFARHCQIDNDMMETNVNNGLMVFRESVSEVLHQLASIINIQKLIEFFFSIMSTCTSNDLEICLFIIASVASKIDRCEDKIVQNIIAYVLKIDINSNVSILAMGAKVLCEFDRWIGFYHQQYLLNILIFLVDIINKNTIAGSSAATALGQIMSTCGTKMEPYLEELMTIFQNIHVYFVHSKAKLKIIKGITHVGCDLSEPKRTEFLKILSDIQFSKVFESQSAGNYVVHQLDCLVEIYHNMNVHTSHNQVNPLDQILSNHWPYICYLLDAYQTNCEVMTKISEAVECAIPNISLSALPLLDQIAKQFMFYFGISKCPLLLRPLNAIVDKLGSDENFRDGLLTLFEGLTVLVMNVLTEDMKLQLVDEYFYLTIAYLKKLAVNMLKSPTIIPVIEMSIELCKIGDKSTNGYVLDFLICILTCNQSHPDIKLCVEQAMTLFGGLIIRTLMESAIYVFDVSLISKVVNIFDAFRSKSYDGYKELMNHAVAMIPNKSTTGTLKAKETDFKKFLEVITRQNLSKSDMINEINEFRKLVRG